MSCFVSTPRWSAAICSAAGSTRRVQGNARLAEASVAEEAAAALDATDKDVAIGGAGLAAQAIELDLADDLRMFRYRSPSVAARA